MPSETIWDLVFIRPLLYSEGVGSTILIIVMLYLMCRPRPDYLWRCYPDGNFSDGQMHHCTGEWKDVVEGRKSFPSGHASCKRQCSPLLSMTDSCRVGMFAGMVFLSLYLASKMSVFRRNGRGHSLRLIIVLLPILAAMIVAITRMRDYWHHWEGVYLVCVHAHVHAVTSYFP